MYGISPWWYSQPYKQNNNKLSLQIVFNYSKILFYIYSCSTHDNNPPPKNLQISWKHLILQKIPILTKIVFTIIKTTKVDIEILKL